MEKIFHLFFTFKVAFHLLILGFLILKAYTIHHLLLWWFLHTKTVQHDYNNLLHSFSPLMKTMLRSEAFIIVSHSHINLLCLYADMILAALVGFFFPLERFSVHFYTSWAFKLTSAQKCLRKKSFLTTVKQLGSSSSHLKKIRFPNAPH